MHAPEEAIEELDAIGALGFRPAVFPGYVKRPVATAAGTAAALHATWLDTCGLDGLYDYDPVWERCATYRIPFVSHGGGIGWGARVSTWSFTYNHIGHFAAAGEAPAKSFVLSGVTWPFPGLSFACLEDGVAWACALHADLAGHWRKRNHAVLEQYDPLRFDLDRFVDLARRDGGRAAEAAPAGALGIGWAGKPVDSDERGEWHACGAASAEDVSRLFTEPFYFGCEADDPTTSWAFSNPVRLYCSMNPDFFGGTVVEAVARAVVGERWAAAPVE